MIVAKDNQGGCMIRRKNQESSVILIITGVFQAV